jgi:aspartyl-tRNA(Asn)/glutamyl-tRNA(Gln) amidotransferase subunit C
VEFTSHQIDAVAHLARIDLTPEERQSLGQHLASVLDYVAKLEELDTADVEPMAHVMGLQNVFREDQPRPSTPRNAMLANAPDQACGCYLVPRVIT